MGLTDTFQEIVDALPTDWTDLEPVSYTHLDVYKRQSLNNVYDASNIQQAEVVAGTTPTC